MRTQINESLSYLDMEGHMVPVLGIDEFQSRIGEDSDIITLNFIVSSKAVAEDLVNWLERGYDWIIDAEISPGEVLDKQFYVFAEMNRRTNAPKRIVEMLEDLNTLTGIDVSEWTCKVNGQRVPANVDALADEMILNPSKYKTEEEGELNEWREIAGLPTKQVYDTTDEELRAFQRQAGII